MDTHCFSRLGTPWIANHASVIARSTMDVWLILQCPLRLLLALCTSLRPIPKRSSLRLRVLGLPHCLSASRLCSWAPHFYMRCRAMAVQ